MLKGPKNTQNIVLTHNGMLEWFVEFEKDRLAFWKSLKLMFQLNLSYSMLKIFVKRMGIFVKKLGIFFFFFLHWEWGHICTPNKAEKKHCFIGEDKTKHMFDSCDLIVLIDLTLCENFY